jgi:predicted MFS family arabinose efflux permease
MLYSLMLGMFALGTDLFVMAGVLPRIAADLGVDLARAGWLVGAFALVYGLAAPLLAAITAGLSRRTAALGALALFALANVLSALSTSFALLLASRVLAALGAATFSPLASSVAAMSVAPERRGRALALVLAGTSGATVLGSPLGTWIAHAWGWRATFGAVSALALLAIAGLWNSGLPRQRAVGAAGLRERFAPLAQARVLLVLLPLLLWMMAGFNLYTYLPALLAGAGDATAHLETLLLLYGLGGLAGSWVGGRLADRFGARRPLLVALLLLGLVYACWPWVVRDAPTAGLVLAAWGITGWSLMPAQQHRLVSLAPQNAGVLLGLFSATLYLGITLGSLLGGVAMKVASQPARALPLTSAALVAAAFLAVALARTRRVQAMPCGPRCPDASAA